MQVTNDYSFKVSPYWYENIQIPNFLVKYLIPDLSCLVPNIRDLKSFKETLLKTGEYMDIEKLLEKHPSLNWVTECYKNDDCLDSIITIGYNGFYIGRIIKSNYHSDSSD